MFTIQGKAVYIRAFIAFDRHSRKRYTSVINRRLDSAGSCIIRHTIEKDNARYPIELGEISGLSEHRPLWVFNTQEKVVLVSPKDIQAEISQMVPEILGEDISLLDLSEIKEGVDRIEVTDSYYNRLRPQIVPSKNLTTLQTVQILSVGYCYLPRVIKVHFESKDGTKEVAHLFSHLHFQGPSDRWFMDTLALCNNLLENRIRYPFNPDDFGKIKFYPNYKLYDTIFELDTTIIQDLHHEKQC